jgi:hypothetical protein
MAIAFNAATSNAVESNTISVNHAAAGADRYVLIGVYQHTDHTISAISYGSQTPGLITEVGGRLHLYGLVAPATGTQSVSVTSNTSAGFVIAAVSYTGVDQTGPLGTPVSNTTSSTTSIDATVTSAVGQLVVDLALMINTSMAAAVGQTERISLDDPGVGFFSLGMSEKAGASSVTTTWTSSATFGNNRILAVPLIASAGGGSGLNPIFHKRQNVLLRL